MKKSKTTNDCFQISSSEGLNINISTPTEVLGEAELTGNININTALKAFEDITLNGEVKNTNDSVIYPKYGDIVIDSTNVNLNGLVYAPFGSVDVKAMNLNLNNVVIIADSIVLDCPNVNANYSTNAADFVGTISEPLNIPKDEWPYMKDENGNGLPDFFEDCDNWKKLADTDGDGLPDSIEEYLGSDVNNTDTDGDGLGDYYEVFSTYTDPTMADTDENVIKDGDEDFDEDGLTNLEELLNETYPYSEDSDNGGLSDGDEVNNFGTDPLVADTDGDGLDDGDEIILSTDPLIQDTDGDGVIDSREKFQQTYTHKVKNEDCAVTEVIVDMECTGNINKTTSVESVMNVDILCTDVVGLIGEPFEIETTSEFDKATLTFKIDKDKLDDIPFDNLLFLWYNEEENKFVELETTIDADNNTVSIITTHFSKYMVVDRQAWFDNWREIYARFENLSEKSLSITAICVDCSGSMRSNDKFFYIEPYVQTCYRDIAVKQFVNAMFTNDQTSIIAFASNATKKCSLTSDKDLLLKNASFYSNGNTNANAAINIEGGQPYWSWYGFWGVWNGVPALCHGVPTIADILRAGLSLNFLAAWTAQIGLRVTDNGKTEITSRRQADIIFFDWEGDGETDHVGIVEKCENGVVYTVEGNSGDACRQNQYTVGSSSIYGCPAY